MSASEETLTLLRSIDASLKRLVAQGRAAETGTVASDRDLDSKWGDPVVKFMPRDWTGERCTGRKFSECQAPFLHLMADALEYFASQSEAKNELTDKGKPVADYKRQDAARARGWAKRITDGRVPAGVGAGDPEWGGSGNDGF